MIGRIVDEHHRPVDFANVALLSVGDSTFITGGVTNENGQFVIPCEAKRAIVKVSCVGYQTLSRIYSVGKLGDITMKEATMNLQKVVVKGHRPLYKTEGTKLVVDIQKSVLSDFGNADDVIAQLPTVSGSDGSYSVFGRGNADIYIGNRKMRDNSELSRLSSKDIATVEVINNPGVEYDADTHAVIKINLKHKQEGGLGVRTSVFDSQGRKDSDTEQVQLTYDTQRVNAFLSFNNSSSRYKTDQSNIEETKVDDVVWRMESEMPKWNVMFNADIINRESKDSRLNQESGSKTSSHDAKNENETTHHIYAGNIKVNYQATKNLAFSAGADASYMDEKKDYSAFENEESQTSSSLHAEETKLAAFAGCDFSIDKLSSKVGLRFETFEMLYRDAVSQDKLVDKTQRHLYPYFLFLAMASVAFFY